MKYVVYNVDTIRHVWFADKAAAKRSCTVKNKKEPGKYAMCDQETFNRDVNYEVDTYNMMDPTRKPIKIRRSELGGCCDPATETYHSM